MSDSTEFPSVSPTTEPDLESRKILGPAGNRVKVKEEEKESLKKKDVLEKKPKRPTIRLQKMTPQIVVRKNNDSLDSSCSLKSSSSSGSSVKIPSVKRKEKHDSNSLKMEGEESPMMTLSLPFKRCDWITKFSGMKFYFEMSLLLISLCVSSF